MELLKVLFLLSLFVNLLANPTEDEFSDSDEETDNENDNSNDEEDNTGIPEHKFEVKKITYMSGKKKGQEKTLVNLLIPPNTFSRKKVQNNVTTFNCLECLKDVIELKY